MASLDETGPPEMTPSDPTLVLEFQGAGIPGPYVRDLAPRFSNGGCERRLVREWIAGYDIKMQGDYVSNIKRLF